MPGRPLVAVRVTLNAAEDVVLIADSGAARTIISRRVTALHRSELVDELLGRDTGLSQDATQCADRQVAVQGHGTARGALWRLLLENDVAAALTDAHEA